MAELILTTEAGPRAFPMKEGKPLFAGRAAACDIVLDSPSVSRHHVVFMARNGQFGVKDLDSANGTYRNGRRIDKPVKLEDGDVIKIVGFTITFAMSAGDKCPLAAKPGKTSARKSRRSLRRKAPENGPAAKRPAAPPAESPALSEMTHDSQLAADEDPTAMAAQQAAPQPEPNLEAESEALAAVLGDSGEDEDSHPAPEGGAAADPAPDPAAANGPAIPHLGGMGRRPFRPGTEAPEDEIGDGADDHAFAVDEHAESGEETKPETNKAAEEAGIVGEFAPDTEEAETPAQQQQQQHQAQPPRPHEAPAAANPLAMPIPPEFRQAIETRLLFYSLLADLACEREEMLAKRPKMPEAAKAELARQDREAGKPPAADQAEERIAKIHARREELRERIREAREKNELPPPRPSRDMRDAEELALAQWAFIVQSEREALPAVYDEGMKIMADEPLARCLADAGVDPVQLMGGGAYLLALDTMAEEAKALLAGVRSQTAAAPSGQPEKRSGLAGLFGKPGKRDAEDEAAEERARARAEEDKRLADNLAWIAREADFVEKRLILEFWRVYAELAVRHIADSRPMPPAVRAFLRHGVIGFKRWWMRDEVRLHIVEDVSSDVLDRMEIGADETNILYADEYLAAVRALECTPAIDENLEINERNSPAWKADKALRRLINARSQSTLMAELTGTLQNRIDGVHFEIESIEAQMDKLLPGSQNYKQNRNALAQKRQALKVETSKLAKLVERIRGEWLPALDEAVREVKEKFDSGELDMPGPDFLVRRECEALRKIGRLLANLKERFMPMVVRESYQTGTDALNDRQSIRGEILATERRDPGIFLKNVVPAKKRANRVDLRISPVVVLIPSAGMLAYSWNPRNGPEDGRLAIPTCFIRRRIRERQMAYLMADFRWDTSKASAGMDILTSDTIVAAFMTVRWDWRKRSREAREKGLIYTDLNDRANWRRVYEAYLQTAFEGGKKLYNRNYDFYERIIGKYFDLPDNVSLLKK